MNFASISILFFQLIFSGILLSQTEFVPGYIINSKHDTLLGEIKLNLKNEVECFSKINFREKPNGPTRSYQPNKIDGFGIENDHYHSIRIENHWVYMLVHCQGKISVFEYKPPASSGNQKLKSDFYVMKGGFDNIHQIAIDNKLKKHIRQFFSDDKSLWKEFEKSEFDFSTLLQIASSYNERNK